LKKGTVPFLANHSCALSDDDVIPVQELSYPGGTEAAVVKPSWAFKFFWTFLQNQTIKYFKITIISDIYSDIADYNLV